MDANKTVIKIDILIFPSMKKHFQLLLAFALILTLNCNAQISGFARSTDSALIYYRTYGKGQPLLIINGGPGMNSNGFEQLAIELSKNYQTIIYDQRGTGKSTLANPDTASITMKLMLDDIESIRKHLNIPVWFVLGHSFGGMVASYYATQYPGHIKKIVLSSSGGIDLDILGYAGESINSKLSKTSLDSINYWTSRISQGDTSHFAALARGKLLAPAYVMDQKYLPIIAERLTQGNSTINMLIWTALQNMNFDCSEGLKKFDKPVLIIQGKNDIVKEETALKAHRVLKNSKVVFLDHSIHYGWIDNKKVYFEEIRAFLG